MSVFEDQVTKESRNSYRSTARQLGCDEDEAAFDEKLKQIAKHRPTPASGSEGGTDG